jgi:hypothetical protein
LAQSFLNIPGLPRGLRNNNPGNLRVLPGGQKWLGEIDPDPDGFSRFSDIAYGLRAMITDLAGDIMRDGRNTIRKLIYAYAPPSENDTEAYINSLAAYTGIGADTIITANRETVDKLIHGQLNIELGANYAAKIAPNDFTEAFARVGNQVAQWLGTPAGLATGGSLLLVVLAFTAYFVFRKR